MNDQAGPSRRRRRIGLTLLILIGGALVALATHEYSSIYTTGRRAKNAAGAAAMAGVRRLAYMLNYGSLAEDQIEADMREHALRNELAEGDELVGYYLDAEGSRLGPVGSGVSWDIRGVEAVVTTRADITLSRLLGLAGWPIQRDATVRFELRYSEEKGRYRVVGAVRMD